SGNSMPLTVFKATAEHRPAVYFAFDTRIPDNPNSFFGKELHLYLQIKPLNVPTDLRPGRSQPKLGWEWWTDDRWTAIGVQDTTNSLARSGLVSFLVPPTVSKRTDFDFDVSCYWLRVVLEDSQYEIPMGLHAALLNTIQAAQTITVPNEIL